MRKGHQGWGMLWHVLYINVHSHTHTHTLCHMYIHTYMYIAGWRMPLKRTADARPQNDPREREGNAEWGEAYIE